MVPSASIPAVRQNRSKLTETASQALSTAPIPVGGKAVNGVIAFFMALLSFRGISTPSLPAQGEQRRSSYFNIPRGNSLWLSSANLLRPAQKLQRWGLRARYLNQRRRAVRRLKKMPAKSN